MNETKIGCNCIVEKDGKILLGLRKNCYLSGTYGLPGGHLEHGESLIDGARRELREEAGIEATDIEFASINDQPKDPLGKHYIHVTFLVRGYTGEPHLTDDDRTEKWEWFSLDALPEKLFPPHIPVLEGYKKGIRYS